MQRAGCNIQVSTALWQVPWKLVAGQLQQLGFEPGWGKNVGIIRATMHELLDILEVCCRLHWCACSLDLDELSAACSPICHCWAGTIGRFWHSGVLLLLVHLRF